MNRYSEKGNERIREMLATINVISDECSQEDSDEENDDNVEPRFEDTDTKQEMSDGDSEKEDNTSLSYIGKDRVATWKKEKPRSNVKTRSHNIVTQPNSVKGVAKNSKIPKESWNHFIDENVIDLIVECTNKYIEDRTAFYSRQRDAKKTLKEEIYALIGLLYLAGIYRSGRQNIYD